MEYLVKKDSWVLEDDSYKVHIPFDNPNDENVIITFTETDEDKLDTLYELIVDVAPATLTECTLIANSKPDFDFSVDLELLSNMPGSVENYIDENGEEKIRYVADSLDDALTIFESINNIPVVVDENLADEVLNELYLEKEA